MLALVVEALKNRVHLHRKFRATLDELQSMDRRELDDIGISAADLVRVARRHTYGV